ncbi:MULTISPECIES: efflux transporter outer membrane subunit [unclassified Acidovorax]|uniref:efflux transporter outer membrane subunit n=1 Tax=unclassified Acidovorax TaxID=2684926 RepID=UPI002882F138|nr:MULTISPECIES: efflux transporter outer membrane subunit [unclassified Acidovorax]
MTPPRLPLFRALPWLALPALSVLAGCTAGPDYQRPALQTPAAFRHDAGWSTVPAPGSTPGAAPDTASWSLFADPALQSLLDESGRSNQTIAQAEARFRQAQARLDGNRADRLPQLTANAGATRSGGGGGSNSSSDNDRSAGTRYNAGLQLSWTPDLWGRVRRLVEAGQAGLQASAADVAGARLAVQSLAAQAYFQLRIIDRQNALLQQTLASYDRALQLTRNQYDAGLVARADVIQSETQRESLRVQIFELARVRTQTEHAVAVLLGRAPGDWQLAPEGGFALSLPAVPGTLPSTLLLRRPDVVVAERQVAAANAAIGVAQSAWWPDLTLSASAGGNASQLARLLDTPSRVWSLGPTLAATLFDGGRRAALTAEAQAQYDERVAAYRQSALVAWQEVEDALSGLLSLAGQAAQQQRLVALAQENERVVTNRYREGLVNFLELSTAQNLTYTSQRAALETLGLQLATQVRLVAALGGGWTP